MYAIEFEADIQDGVVKIPPEYSRLRNSHAKIVVMVRDESAPSPEAASLDLSNLRVEAFQGRDAVEVQREMRDEW
ncbi:hypothetical protein SAMN05216203_1032 [Marinobacter daqiaonensis]|uniref:Uncharacterized protein n=1 Tax=Marinobacter daqiaonensis TaxID=650891 RepID=A0A1I6H9T2_9GAMM|nr:hypothetical protein [Marinobacter daqiaonensis]SFR51263.1 hypothetical protein SAMN05216203_1032 [Marinobacter daqiaonensis]